MCVKSKYVRRALGNVALSKIFRLLGVYVEHASALYGINDGA